MNYWLATTEFPPFHGGGISTYSFNVVEALRCAGHDLTVIVIDRKSKRTRFEKNDKIKQYIVSQSEWSDYDLRHTDFGASSALRNFLQDLLSKDLIQAPDALEITDWGALPFFFECYKREHGDLVTFPIIVSTHGPQSLLKEYNKEPSNILLNQLLKQVESKVYTYADLVIAPTKYAMEELSRYYKFSETIRSVVIDYPFTAVPFKEKVKKSKPNKTLQVLFFGRKQYLKGFDLYIDAIKSRRDEKIVFSVLGGDSWFFSDQKFGSEMILESNIFDHGLKQPNAIRDILMSNKLIVFPSRAEWFSYAILEAMSCGLTIVLPRGLGSTEMVEGFGYGAAVTYFPNNVEKLNEAIDKALCVDAAALDSTQFSIKLKERNKKYIHDLESILTNLINRSPAKTPQVQWNEAISVAIPHFNLSKYLSTAILSVLSCGVPSSSVYVIDDGSSEHEFLRAAEICLALGVNIQREKNGGLSCTRNLAVDLIETKYIIFLDADDWISKEYLCKAILLMDRDENIAAVGSSVNLVSENGKKYAEWRSWDPTRELNGYVNMINSAGLVWRRDVVKSLHGFDTKFSHGFEDWDLVNRALLMGWKIDSIKSCEFNYRVRKNGMFKTMQEDYRLNAYSNIVQRFENEKESMVIKSLIDTFGNGYALSNLVSGQSPARYKLISKIRARVPFIELVWNLLPPKMKSAIYKKLN
jgi:glycosyltransferase involved in cell wall biosynthesis